MFGTAPSPRSTSGLYSDIPGRTDSRDSPFALPGSHLRERVDTEPPFTVDFPERFPAERRGAHWRVEADGIEVRLSNLQKVLWPEEGITKGDLLAYYWNVAPYLLPHLEGRPLTLKRMPDGLRGGHFYQKDAPDHTPDWMPRCAIEPEDGHIDQMLIVNAVPHLLFVANLGAIDLHPLHARCERYDWPDFLVFDLDPFPPATFGDVLVVARHVEAALRALDLEGFAKSSGATGIQVYVPVAERYTFDETRALAGHLGQMIRDADPEQVTMRWPVEERRGRVFIDHNMNRRAASLAAPYSVRPRSGAPVSTPLRWNEVEEGLVRPEMFRIDTIFGRLAECGEIFSPVTSSGQDLTAALEKLDIRLPSGDISQGRLRRFIAPRT